MSLARLIAGCCGLAAIGTTTWWLMTDHPIPDPGPATTKVGAVARLRADVPEIGDFASFNVNNENPFIPYHLRAADQSGVPVPKIVTGPKAPVEVLVTKPNPLPRAGSGAGLAPTCAGLITTAAGNRLILRFPSETSDRSAAIGDTVNGWTITGVDHGTVALLRDPNGIIQRVLIGQ